MTVLSIKKKDLDIIYNKVVEQSKNIFYLKDNQSSSIELIIEFFQLNLILILWYMKSKKMTKQDINYLIEKFIKEMECSFIELGGSETKLRKTMRIITENFYGRLFSYSVIFDKFDCTKINSEIVDLIKRNFGSSSNTRFLESYLKNNIKYLKKLRTSDFCEKKFFFKNN